MSPKVQVLGQEITEEEKREFEAALEREVVDSQLDAMKREWLREHPEVRCGPTLS